MKIDGLVVGSRRNGR